MAINSVIIALYFPGNFFLLKRKMYEESSIKWSNVNYA